LSADANRNTCGKTFNVITARRRKVTVYAGI
jgi:hypothetical protein